MSLFDLQTSIIALEATGQYRVLRRQTHDDLPPGDGEDVGHVIGVAVDCEATGLDPRTAKIIELSARLFWATYDGRITHVGELRTWLEDPGEPLSLEVAALTGLTDADLAGEKLDDDAIAAMLVRADLIVAHNAAYDRPLIEARLPRIAGFAWACSCRDFAWAANGYDGRALGRLLYQCGQFRDRAHRAGSDVDATIALLRHVLPSGRTVMAEMRETAMTPSFLVQAVGAAFEVKDALKARRYAWNAGASVWQREVAEAALQAEKEWLALNVYLPRHRPKAFGPHITSVTWTTRYA